MKAVKLLLAALVGLCVLGAFTAVGASAVELEKEKNNPEVLVLNGNISELEGELKAPAGNSSKFVTLGNKTIEATGANLLLKNCASLEGLPKDGNLCKDVPIHFSGYKFGPEAACRSENSKGEKDAAEVVLALLDLHLSAELTSGGVLQPLLLAEVLGTGLEAELKMKCGLTPLKLTGVFACLLLPGLQVIKTTEKVELACGVSATTHDRVTGTCEVLCNEFGGVFGLTETIGEVKEDEWPVIHLEGTLNKEIFIDD